VFNDQWRVVALHQGAGEWSDKLECWINNKGIKMGPLLQRPEVGPHLRMAVSQEG
jgi:hypothetical protein